MDRINEFFSTSLIEEMCDMRFDEFESAYIRHLRDKGIRSIGIDYEQELIDLIAENVNDESQKSKIRNKLNDLEKAIFSDLSESIRRAYKLGFVDGIKLKKEINEILEEEKDGKSE